MNHIPEIIQRWHTVFYAQDVKGLDAVLADDAIFHSPVVHTPQRGKKITTQYLAAAFFLLGGEKAKYVREVYGESDAILEFETEIDGLHVNGVDMIHWNEDGLIDDFKVMIRPLQAINRIHQKMAEMLAQMAKKKQKK